MPIRPSAHPTLRALAMAASLITASGAMAPAQQKQDSIAARAKEAISGMRDSTTLHSAGFFAIGFGGGVKDLSPFQGQHWISLARFMANGAVDLGKPNFLMFLPVGDSLIPVGVAYTRRIAVDASLPTDLAGVMTEWHSHVFCRNLPGEGNALADGADDCKARSGVTAPNQIAMVHSWTVVNPDGPYAHDNPALPFIATGLKAPVNATRDDRLFGLALGESYGAKLPIAHRIEFDAKRAGKASSLETQRAKLRALVPQLRDAERVGNAAKVATLRKSAVDAYGAIAAEYRALSPSPEIRTRYDAEFAQALGDAGHHHM